jgi:hypothetical protein
MELVMATPEVKNTNPQSAPPVQGTPGTPALPADPGRVVVSEAPRTGIYNVDAHDGRVLQQVMLDLGLTMPEFLTGADSRFVANLPKGAQNQLSNLAHTAAGLTAAGASSPAGSAELQGRWADFVSEQKVTSYMDVNALVQWVLREAYMENTKDLQFYAEKVRFYNDLKKQIRDEVTNARKFLSSTIEAAAAWVKQDPDNRTPEQYPLSYNGKEFFDQPEYDPKLGMVPKAAGSYSIAGQSGGSHGISNKGELEAYIKGLEEKLNSVGDDAQLANVDLQNMLQKQQQTLQMMSNISKMLHDTALAIIRKIGG